MIENRDLFKFDFDDESTAAQSLASYTKYMLTAPLPEEIVPDELEACLEEEEKDPKEEKKEAEDAPTLVVEEYDQSLAELYFSTNSGNKPLNPARVSWRASISSLQKAVRNTLIT